jgi:hypothetical protein
MGMGGMKGHGTHADGSDSKWETISEMSQCYGPIRVSKNDKLEVEGEIISTIESTGGSCFTADYNLQKHAP